jgi:DNA-binding NarL/FixJ family response regulator
MDYWVMIVDDSSLARMAVVYAISGIYSTWRHSTWRLVEAQDADTAMSLALDGHIDIALIDHTMPRRDGLSLAADLRHLYPAMPIALITANSQAETIAAAKQLDLTFLPKPRWKDGLAAFLSAAMRRLGG